MDSFTSEKKSNSELDMQALQGISHLEAQLKFKEQEYMELKKELESQGLRHKQYVKELKEELTIYRERVMKQSKADAQLEIYKNKIDEFEELRQRVKELETLKTTLEMENKAYIAQLNEFEKYQDTIDFLKKEITRTKEEKHLQELQFDKQKNDFKDLQQQYTKLEKKYKIVEEKY